MSIVKSFSVGNGDMFYIKHGSDNFTVIDCCYEDEYDWSCQLNEIAFQSKDKKITRFISTHPDNDHIKGLSEFRSELGITNFYCVRNEATKTDETCDFKEYKKLRDAEKAFYLHRGCSRRWMNKKGDGRRSAGIKCLWPIRENAFFKEALVTVKNGGSPNNISPILTYSVNDGVTFMWLGDMETGFLENVMNDIQFPRVDIVFAPHHGRKTGRLPKCVLDKILPRIIIVGEAPASDLEYYRDYNTITQNSSGSITFECLDDKVRVFIDSETYSVDFLKKEACANSFGTYIGTLYLD